MSVGAAAVLGDLIAFGLWMVAMQLHEIAKAILAIALRGRA